MNITAKMIDNWVQVERKRKKRAERIGQFFGRARSVFKVLLIMAVFVFAFNRHLEIQSMASADMHRAVINSPPSVVSDKLRQNALAYEKQVDEIAK